MTLVIRLRTRLMHCGRALRPALCTLYLLKLLVMWERTGTMSTKWKTRLASVFVIAFIAALLGPIAAFASPTDVDEPPEGVTQESTAQLSIAEAEEPEAQTDAIVTEPSEKPAVTTEEKANETKVTTDEPGEKPAVDATNTNSVDESKTTEQPKVEAAKSEATTAQPKATAVQPKTTEQPKVEAAQTTPTVKAAEDVTAQDDTRGQLGDGNVVWAVLDTTLTLTLVNPGIIPDLEDYTEDDQSFASWASVITQIVFDNKITYIGKGSFKDFVGLKELSLPLSLKRIGSEAFSGCTSLTGVNFPNNQETFTTIDSYAFSGCTSLQRVNFFDGVSSIGAHAFDGCTGLENVHFPITLSTIGDNAFDNTPSLRAIEYAGTQDQWSANVSFGVQPLSFTDNIKYKETLTVTFHPNNGAPTIVLETGVNRKIDEDSFPVKPKKDGYTFVGWFSVDGNNGGNEITPNFEFGKILDAYARWNSGDESYVITFDASPGYFTSINVSKTSMNTVDGELKDIPNAPERPGYTFAGWFTDKGEDGDDILKIKFTDHTTVHARWKKATSYKVVFNANEGSFGSSNEDGKMTFYTGSDNKIVGNVPQPVREGYVFLHWCKDPKNEPCYEFNAGETLINEDGAEYLAHWKPVVAQNTTYTITFNANGGTLTGAEKLITNANGKLTKPSNPTRSGYTFSDWWTAASGGTPVDFSKAFTADDTLYAHWTENSTGNSGSSTTNPSNPTTTKPSGSTTTKPSGSTTTKPSGSTTKPSGSTTTKPSGSTTTKPSTSGSSTSNSNSSSNSTTKPSSSTKPTTSGSSTSGTAKYKVISGASGTYAPNSGKSLTVRADGAFAKFTSLQVDGKTLTKNTHYTVREGSTIATLKPAYLDTLSSGKHTLKFNFKDGSTSTNFTVSKAPTSPDDDVDEADANPGDDVSSPDDDASGPGDDESSPSDDDEGGPSDGVVEDEDQPSAPTPSSSSTSAPAASTQNAAAQQHVDSATDDPDTSDGAMLALWLLALGAAIAGFCRVRRSRWDA